MSSAPTEGVELRHTLREKLHMSLSLGVLFLVLGLLEFWLRPQSFRTPADILVSGLLVCLVTYALMSHQFIRADEAGISTRFLLFTKRVLWHQVSTYAADWSVHFEGLASSYGLVTYMGMVTLKDSNGERLLKLKVNCGPVEIRRRLKGYMETQLVHRGTIIYNQ